MRNVTKSAFVFGDGFVMCVAVFIISAGVVLKEGFVALQGLAERFNAEIILEMGAPAIVSYSRLLDS